ncbi:hypothetical protein PQX77_011336 [Marasmius sp. AFHP31]|nr:hypothetical protein PQX77_011336 [Marasmius sp. AFHP31]
MSPNSALLTPPLTPSSSLNSVGDHPIPSRYISVAPICTDIQVDFLEFTFCAILGVNRPKSILDIVTLPDSPSTRVLVLDDLRNAVMLRNRLANIPPILRTCLYRDTHVLHVDFLSPQATKHLSLENVPNPPLASLAIRTSAQESALRSHLENVVGADAVASVHRDPASGVYSVNFFRLSDAERVYNNDQGELEMQVSYEEEVPVIYSTNVKRDSDGFYEPTSSAPQPYQFPPTPPIPGPGPPLPPSHMPIFPPPWVVNEQPPPFGFLPPWYAVDGAMLPGVPGPPPPPCCPPPPQPEPSYWMPVPPMLPQPPFPLMVGGGGFLGDSQHIQFNSAVEDAFARAAHYNQQRRRESLSLMTSSGSTASEAGAERASPPLALASPPPPPPPPAPTSKPRRDRHPKRPTPTPPQPPTSPSPTTPPTTTTTTNGTRTTNILSLSKIASGADTRTTVMIKNVPNKLSSTDLLSFIHSTVGNRVDFLYLRIDFRNECNFGYAFVNFIGVEDLVGFVRERGGRRWNLHSSNKILELCYADYQGKEALVEKFKNSGIMDEKPEWRPRIFHSEEGPLQGLPEPFPEATHQRRKERGRSLREEEGPVHSKQWKGNGNGKTKNSRRRGENPFGVLAVQQEEVPSGMVVGV